MSGVSEVGCSDVKENRLCPKALLGETLGSIGPLNIDTKIEPRSSAGQVGIRQNSLRPTTDHYVIFERHGPVGDILAENRSLRPRNIDQLITCSNPTDSQTRRPHRKEHGRKHAP